MKYKDYYAALGVARDASAADIKSAYRKLAQKYHPDVTKDPKGEEKFKDIAEAYQTLKDPEKRAAYDRLGSGFQPGQDFRPPPDWEQQFRRAGPEGEARSSTRISTSPISSRASRARGTAAGATRADMPIPGADFEVTVHLTLEEADRGTQVDLNLSVPEVDAAGSCATSRRRSRHAFPGARRTGSACACAGRGARAPTAVATATCT